MLWVQDVTERKSRESRLRRAESLASLTTLAAGVAHEIKNPLGSMGIHIQLIQRALKAGRINETALGHDLDVINEEINRLNGIVVDFLFAVRPMDTTLVLGSLNKSVTDLVEVSRTRARTRKGTRHARLDRDRRHGAHGRTVPQTGACSTWSRTPCTPWNTGERSPSSPASRPTGSGSRSPTPGREFPPNSWKRSSSPTSPPRISGLVSG